MCLSSNSHCRSIPILLLILLWGGTSHAQPSKAVQRPTPAPTSSPHFVKHHYIAGDGFVIDYWLMTPANLEEDKRYPLVLSLHGRGGNTRAATELGSNALREEFPCYVFAPASTKAGHWLRPEGRPSRGNRKSKAMLPVALEAFDAVIEQHPIDKRKVYVTGQSMGGAGTYGSLTLRPDVFAAAIPVCGGWNLGDADKFRKVALWIFHGDQDKVVPTEYSRRLFQAITNAGGNPKYTEYQGVGHDSWSRAYANRETWSWLFSQERSE